MYEVYEANDGILPIIELPKPCEIRLEITDDRVKLIIGPRDMDWDRKTGEMKGSGTMLNSPVVDDTSPTLGVSQE